LLDTDLYKLTMQCAVLKYFPDIGICIQPVRARTAVC
jgi:nicotinic acid phosphoribosyltransferase